MPPRQIEHPPSLIDDALPVHDFSAAYEISIKASPVIVYERLLISDFNALWIVRVLLALRSGRWPRRTHEPQDLHQRLAGTGFMVLSEVPNDELVIGVAGRFWRPDGGRCFELTADNFNGFCRAGYAKAAWNFKLRGATATVLSTETRIQCYGPAARWRFRLYWSLIAPFSGLIRTAMLKQIKSESEAQQRQTLL